MTLRMMGRDTVRAFISIFHEHWNGIRNRDRNPDGVDTIVSPFFVSVVRLAHANNCK